MMSPCGIVTSRLDTEEQVPEPVDCGVLSGQHDCGRSVLLNDRGPRDSRAAAKQVAPVDGAVQESITEIRAPCRGREGSLCGIEFGDPRLLDEPDAGYPYVH